MYQKILRPPECDKVRRIPYAKEPRYHEILHIKCPIIRLIKCQIEHAENNLCTCIQRKNSWNYKLWKHRWLISTVFLTVVLMIFIFIYGAVIGAGLCSSGLAQHSTPCPRTFSFLPGVHMTKYPSILY